MIRSPFKSEFFSDRSRIDALNAGFFFRESREYVSAVIFW
ncbi:hypothetical protein CHCC20348_3202 [Bacillus paralicheniformis]|nr:hypothetical protein CHCC20348_3202 [Bacillus paralicheniformis]